MQMLVSWPTVAAAEEPEKLLYTYLKYAFLLKCRRDRRYSFQALSAIDFESVQLSLARQGDADPIELQDGLRRILLYLNWRKIHAKCASVLLLRFFHGFFPFRDYADSPADEKVSGYWAGPREGRDQSISC